jgi:hypothetical protein
MFYSVLNTAEGKQLMRTPIRIVTIGVLALAGAVFLEGEGAAANRIGIPLNCSKGPSDQQHKVQITVPPNAALGSVYKVRIDGVDSGKISHIGLNYIFDMWSEWLVPSGTKYVEGSARIVPDTGSPNVRPKARVVHQNGVINLVLPAHVDNGSSYTPPSFEFSLKVTGAPGSSIAQAFRSYRVTANAFLMGDVKTTCEPKPKPFPVATTKVTPAPAPPAAPPPSAAPPPAKP